MRYGPIAAACQAFHKGANPGSTDHHEGRKGNHYSLDVASLLQIGVYTAREEGPCDSPACLGTESLKAGKPGLFRNNANIHHIP
jgi:hypothetical protein